MKRSLSLKGRGMQLLAQREHSRSELRRKLMVHALAAQSEAAMVKPAQAVQLAPHRSEASAQERAPGQVDSPSGVEMTAAEQVEAVLDWLQANRYLNEERFVESRVHARSSRFGNLRIRQELAQHGVPLDPDLAQRLRETEADRAQDVWQRKFGQFAQDASERAKQMRFLAGRGFSIEVVRRVVQGVAED